MITRVQVKNFRSLADVDVELGALTVLVGRNGAGKSAFLDVLRFVRDALRIGLEDAIIDRHGIAALRRWSPRKPFNLEVTLTVKESQFWGEYSFVIGSKQGVYKVTREACRVGKESSEISEEYEVEGGKFVISPQSIVKRSIRYERPEDVRELVLPSLTIFSPTLSRMRVALRGNFYSIFPNVLRQPQKPSTEKTLTDHGENLASVLRQMIGEKDFPNLLSSLSRVVEGVSDIRVGEASGFLVPELQHNNFSSNTATDGHSPWFNLTQESDGTLRMLGMLVALYQTQPRRTLVALEEPENALHPGALAVLSDVLREATRRHQILVTTQSPDLISRFNVDELRVVERAGSVTEIGPVDETQRKVIEEQLFSAGDLLRIEGLRREPVVGAEGSHA